MDYNADYNRVLRYMLDREPVGSSDVRAIAAGILAKPSAETLPLKMLRDALVEDGSVSSHPVVEAYNKWVEESEKHRQGDPEAKPEKAFRELGRNVRLGDYSFHAGHDRWDTSIEDNVKRGFEIRPQTGHLLEGHRFDSDKSATHYRSLPMYRYDATKKAYLPLIMAARPERPQAPTVIAARKKIPPHKVVEDVLSHGGIESLLHAVVGAHKWAVNNDISQSERIL